MRQFHRFGLRTLLLSLLFSACVSIKPSLTEIPEEDLATVIYYRNGISPGDDGEFFSRMIRSSNSTPLLAQRPDPSVVALATTSTIEPSISSDGKYVAVFRGGNDESKHVAGERTIGIFGIEKKDFVFDARTKISCATHQTASYAVPWSCFGHSFYIVVNDTIMKCTPEGKRIPLTYIENLSYFSVSPTEHWIFFSQGSRIAVFDLETQAVVRVRDFDKLFGITVNRCVRTVAWSPDDKKVAFAEGYRIVVMDLTVDEEMTHKVSGDVFTLEWLSNDEYFYVEGYQPYELAQLKADPYFGIWVYSLKTGKDTLLHDRQHHEPVSVQPKLSPSGKLLLFSEYDPNYGYQVKVMAMDGSGMETVCGGYRPVWGK